MSKVKGVLLFFAAGLLFACGGGKNNPKPVPQPVSPGKAVLLSPAQNSICTTGTNTTPTQSTINFQWQGGANTESYLLTVTNLITNKTTTLTTNDLSAGIVLTRATPYSWTITSKSSKTSITTTSDSWKFYNSGIGITSYAPFPATITYPAMGQIITTAATTITLTWTGSDPDGDLTGYDIYFGTTNTPTLLKSVGADVGKLDVTVSSNKLYYWKVVSKDAQGNNTDSGIYQFKTD